MRTILPYTENPHLRETAREVSPEDIPGARIQKLISEMSALLAKEEYGVALAAPQVGESVRIFIVSGRALARETEDKPRRAKSDREEPASGEAELLRTEPKDQVYINPVLTKVSRLKRKKHEGCLSVRGIWGMVPRSEKATIRALDERGTEFTRGASGFLAHIFQHEMDHLEGILYTDKAVELYEENREDA